MAFLDELEQAGNSALTENGAVTNRSTLDPLLDFFSRAGAMRSTPEFAGGLFAGAYNADPVSAIKCLFYLRDVRGGQGERAVFRACLRLLAEENIEQFFAVAPLVSEYGRWDDLLHIVGLDLGYVVPTIAAQLDVDEGRMARGESVSLLAKWLPSEKASSKATQKLALALMKALDMKPREYRRTIVKLRAYIKLLETQMSRNQWGDIDYEHTPGQALRKHTKAFYRHDDERFKAYLEAATTGEKKLKASTLFTYEVYEAAESGDTKAADAMWANLPDYTNGKPALVVADVSGSMMGRPMAVSVSLALYFATRNQGAFNGYFLTFSERPKLQKVVGKTLHQQMNSIEQSQWGMNTNLQAAFQAILDAAIAAKAGQEDIPAVLYIISDMEFDRCVGGANETNFERARRDFREHGYELPHVVFWNVNARNMQSPATKFDTNVTLISGLSASTFQYAVAGKTPLESMMDILNGPRYAAVDKALAA
jgi:hypothetical protein